MWREAASGLTGLMGPPSMRPWRRGILHMSPLGIPKTDTRPRSPSPCRSRWRGTSACGIQGELQEEGHLILKLEDVPEDLATERDENYSPHSKRPRSETTPPPTRAQRFSVARTPLISALNPSGFSFVRLMSYLHTYKCMISTCQTEMTYNGYSSSPHRSGGSSRPRRQ